MSLVDGAPAFAPAEWWPDAMLWLGFFGLVAAIAVAVGVWGLVGRLRALGERAKALEGIEEIRQALQRLLAVREELDLRRVEHLLLDLRDGSRRLEELLLRVPERAAAQDALVPAVPTVPGNVAERVVNRLLALGYERVELIGGAEELASLGQADGQVLVEARREGVPCKGRVTIRSGRIEAVHLQPAFPAFP